MTEDDLKEVIAFSPDSLEREVAWGLLRRLRARQAQQNDEDTSDAQSNQSKGGRNDLDKK